MFEKFLELLPRIFRLKQSRSLQYRKYQLTYPQTKTNNSPSNIPESHRES